MPRKVSHGRTVVRSIALVARTPTARRTGLARTALTTSALPVSERPADLHVGTVDPQGRLRFRRPAQVMGWPPHHRVALEVQGTVVRLADSHDASRGIAVSLDSRCRLLVPYGLRPITGFRPGARVLVVAVPDEGRVAVLPVREVVAAFVRDP